MYMTCTIVLLGMWSTSSRDKVEGKGIGNGNQYSTVILLAFPCFHAKNCVKCTHARLPMFHAKSCEIVEILLYEKGTRPLLHCLLLCANTSGANFEGIFEMYFA